MQEEDKQRRAEAERILEENQRKIEEQQRKMVRTLFASFFNKSRRF
jgi:F0F1-type ATP synthase membrane subunit b/b'